MIYVHYIVLSYLVTIFWHSCENKTVKSNKNNGNPCLWRRSGPFSIDVDVEIIEVFDKYFQLSPKMVDLKFKVVSSISNLFCGINDHPLTRSRWKCQSCILD